MLVIAFYRKKALVRCTPHSEHLVTWLTCLLVSPSLRCCSVIAPCWLTSSASKSSIRWSLNVKLGPRCKSHKGWAVWFA